jgi:hypothetical protein
MGNLGGSANIASKAFSLGAPLAGALGADVAEKDATSNIMEGIGSVASMFGPIGMGIEAGLQGLSFLNQIGGKRTNASVTQGLSTGAYATKTSPGANTKNTLAQTLFGKKFKATNRMTAEADYHNILANQAATASTNAINTAQNSFQVVANKNTTNLMGGIDSRILTAKKGSLLSKNALKTIKAKATAKVILDKANRIQEVSKTEEIQDINVIPEGALHARLNNYGGELGEQVTNKGIPVISYEDDNKIQQHAEIENSEIIFHKKVSTKLEELYKEYKKEDSSKKKKELEEECGRLLTSEILENTQDNVQLIDKV